MAASRRGETCSGYAVTSVAHLSASSFKIATVFGRHTQPVPRHTFQPAFTCRCDGCKKFYHEQFGEDLPKDWNAVGWRRRELFKEAKVAQAVRRLHEACKAVKPSVEIWQNQLNINNDFPLSAMKYVDMAYIEDADPVGLLFHDSATPKNGFIVGKLENLGFKTMRLCLALGGHGYTYIKARHDTALPPVTEEEADLWRRQRGWTSGTARANARSRPETLAMLGSFYEMLSKAQSHYEGGQPVYHGVGVVFCEATRYKYPNFSRARYTDILKKLGNAYLEQSLALEYLSSEMLPERDLIRYRVLVLPETSGLKSEELDALLAYVRAGGKLLIAGDALRHDEQGVPLKDFALANEMGIRFSATAGPTESDGPWRWSNRREGGDRATVEVDRAGENILNLWPRESGYRVDRIVLVRDADFEPTPGVLATLASSGQLVSLEAEAFKENIPRGGSEWTIGAAQQPGFSGTGYVGTSGTKDYSKTKGYETQAPELRFATVIPQAGKWYVWIRQHSTLPTNDSVHVGLNGRGQTDVDFDAGGRINAKQAVATASTAGTTLVEMRLGGKSCPMLHVNALGKGQVYYLASSDLPDLLQKTIDSLAGSRPVTVAPAGKQVVLTRQEKRNRWVLHILDDGDCTVEIDRNFAAPTKIAEMYPPEGWTAAMEKTDAGMRVTVRGSAGNRLLVLQ